MSSSDRNGPTNKVERNSALAALAAERGLCVVEADCLKDAGIAAVRELAPTLWVASGSTLCGQATARGGA